MLRSILIIAILSALTVCLRAQDAATLEGQKAIEHRLRFYEGTPIEKFSVKTTNFTIEGQKFSTASPAIYDGIVYIGTDSGCIYSVTESEIKKLCKLENAGAIEGTLAVTKDYVFAGFTNKIFAAFSRTDGKMLWKYETKGPVITAPLFHGKFVYFSTSNGYVYALDTENGSFKWRFNVLSKASAPALDNVMNNDVLFVGNDRQRTYAINTINDERKGTELWHFEGAGRQTVINESDVYGVSIRGNVFSIDKTTGKGVWVFPRELGDGTTDLALANYTIVFGNGRSVWALDSRAWQYGKWQQELPRTVEVPPIIVGDVVYAVCSDGKLYALDLVAGMELSHFDLEGTTQSSPAFVKNKIVYANGGKIIFIGGK
jgi:outer membrane protein assembly factor BamB